MANTAIAAMMELVNELYRAKDNLSTNAESAALKTAAETIVVMLSPFVPHIADELWQLLDNQGMLLDRQWPAFDPQLCEEQEVTLAVQVCGKLRATITVPKDASQDEAEKLALAESNVQRFTEGKNIIKVIYVPNKIVNIIAK